VPREGFSVGCEPVIKEVKNGKESVTIEMLFFGGESYEKIGKMDGYFGLSVIPGRFRLGL
jgi:hypothetical protein